MQKKAITLGNQLVDELGIEPGVDTLSKWIAHYIAEQIEIAENAKGADKTEADERCFRAILQLWQHRAFYPRGHRPFEDFEPIFNTLSRLDPENPQSFYRSFASTGSTEADNSDEKSSVETYTQLILVIDEAARTIIELLLSEATEGASSKKAKFYLKNDISDPPPDELKAIQLLTERNLKNPQNYASEVRAFTIKRLKDRIAKLDKFSALCKSVKKDLNFKLKTAHMREV
ncbi:MAG TPA: hypothetical protein VHC95_13250 [Opitutales bacterium]|nr:hypothetical protein [Opitutales bacterium]